jgi:REP element-mobilizing transposase RayT
MRRAESKGATGRRQLGPPMPNTWGGRRPGAGRKPGPRPWVPRLPRPAHDASHPVHVTLRARREAGSLRARDVFPHLRDTIGKASSGRFRVVHFSVQRDHVQLLVEANAREALIRGLQGLAIRLARAVNRARRRTGKVWADRYDARPLRTPREVRDALVYLLMNWRKQRAGQGEVDPCSSAVYLRGWRDRGYLVLGRTPPVVPPHTWLLRVGWRRHGPLDVRDRPKAG